jgi:hypothetical protein
VTTFYTYPEPTPTPAPENWQVRTTIHEPGHITEHYQIEPDDLIFALGRLIPAGTDAGFAHLLSYSRVVGDVEITRSPIIAWWNLPLGFNRGTKRRFQGIQRRFL